MRIDRIKFTAIMTKYDLTAEKLSKASGVHVGTISRIRCGASCRYETARAIAQALNVPVEELLEEV